MLSDFERKQMRDWKKKQELAKTPAGQQALRYAEQKRKEQEERERILSFYGGNNPEQQGAPAEGAKTDVERRLEQWTLNNGGR